MDVFDTNPPETLNRDRCVVRHEVGHAVTWFSFGEAIGPMFLCRKTGSDQLLAKVACWPRNGDREALLNKDYAEPWAERLLAGDIAGRLAHGGISTNRISADGVILNAVYTVHDIIKQFPENHDVKMVLMLAHNTAREEWQMWVAARLERAAKVANENWHRIESIAKQLEHKLPLQGNPVCIQGTDLIALMNKAGVQSRKNHAIEIVYTNNVGNYGVKARRFYRYLGSHGTVSLYVDAPKDGEENV